MKARDICEAPLRTVLFMRSDRTCGVYRAQYRSHCGQDKDEADVAYDQLYRWIT